MSEPASEVVVVDVDSGTPPPADAPDVVVPVVVDTGDDGGASDGEIDLATRVGRLEAEVAQLRSDVAEAQFTADMAEVTAEVAVEEAQTAEAVAEVAVEEAVEVAEEVTEDDDPDDDTPNRPHFMHRSLGDLLGRK